jgi:hypothetical protein
MIDHDKLPTDFVNAFADTSFHENPRLCPVGRVYIWREKPSNKRRLKADLWFFKIDVNDSFQTNYMMMSGRVDIGWACSARNMLRRSAITHLLPNQQMTQTILKNLLLTCAFFLLPATAANAVTIGTLFRFGSLGSAIEGETASGYGPLTSSVVSDAFGGSWTNEGTVSASTPGLANDLLQITVTGGGWNTYNAGGTWSIDPSFWSQYDSAVIGWKVGTGSGTPDFFLFNITSGQTSGTWSYFSWDILNLGLGAPFSNNVQLYGSQPKNVPDGGATVTLMGLALAGVVVVRRFIKGV